MRCQGGSSYLGSRERADVICEAVPHFANIYTPKYTISEKDEKDDIWEGGKEVVVAGA
jgi:hypothetical protein